MLSAYKTPDGLMFLNLVGHAVRAHKRARIARIMGRAADLNHQRSIQHGFTDMAWRVVKRSGTPPPLAGVWLLESIRFQESADSVTI